MKLLISIVACLVVGLFGCTHMADGNRATMSAVEQKTPSPEPENDSSLSQREYAVMSEIVGRGTVIVEGRTKDNFVSKSVSPEAAESFPGLAVETIDDYNRKNTTQVPVECKFTTATSCTVLSEEAIKQLWNFKNENATEKWKGFKANYGTDRYYSVSRVGFSKDGNQAFVFVAYTCGSLCADGSYYFLLLENDSWKISKRSTVWVS